MSDLLRPAEQYARNGVALTPHIAEVIGNTADVLKAQPGGAAKTLLKGGKDAPHTGQILKNEDLADTISLLRRHGRKAFYEGELAEKIASMDGEEWWPDHGGGPRRTRDRGHIRRSARPIAAIRSTPPHHRRRG